MDFFKYFHFGLKRKYKYFLIGVIIAIIIFNTLSIFGYCASTDSGVLDYDGTKYINGNVISSNSESGRGIAYYYCASPGVFEITNGYSNARYYFVSSSIDVGTVLSESGTISSGQTLTFNINTPGYFLLTAGNGSGYYTYTFTVKSGINSAVADLVNGLSSANIWSVFASSISFISVSILVGLGFWFVVRLVDSISKK